MTTTPTTNSVDRILAEMDALNAVLATIEGTSTAIHEATTLVADALKARPPIEDADDLLVQIAMEKIAGTVNPPVIHRSSPEFFDHALAEDTTLQWVSWVSGGPVILLWPSEIEALPVESSVHETCLKFWRSAIIQIAKGDRSEARRLWKRALDLGSQFGTESHVLVSWSYAASFFTPEVTPVASDPPS